MRIVNNAGGIWAEENRWSVNDMPTVDIGVLEGDSAYQLYNAFGALRSEDGRIVIANRGTQELRFYGPNGRHIRSVGGKGGGPGEFEGLWSVHRFRGDSIAAWDARSKRLSIFDSEGDFARAVTMDAAGGFHPEIVAIFSDGSAIYTPGIIPSELFAAPAGLRRDTRTFIRYSTADGALVDTLGAFLGDQRYLEKSGDGFSIRTIPFGVELLIASSADAFYVGQSDRYQIRVYDPVGRLVHDVRNRHVRPRVTDEDLDRYRSDILERMDDENGRREFRERMEQTPMPDRFPAFDRLKVDAEGSLWVKDFARPGDARPQWTVFDATGGMLGSVNTPPDLQIFDIGADYVLGRWTNDLGVEHIRLHHVVKPEAPSSEIATRARK